MVSTVTVPEQGSGEDESLSVWKNDVYVYIYIYTVYIYIYRHILVGGFNPSEKY